MGNTMCLWQNRNRNSNSVCPIKNKLIEFKFQLLSIHKKTKKNLEKYLFWEIAWGLLLNYKYIQENYKMIEDNSLIDKDWNNLIHYSCYIILSAPLLMTFWLLFFKALVKAIFYKRTSRIPDIAKIIKCGHHWQHEHVLSFAHDCKTTSCIRSAWCYFWIIPA